MSDVTQLLLALQNALQSSSLSELVLTGREGHVLMLEHSQSIGEALKALARRKVLSAPLVVPPSLEDLESEERPDGATLLGWIDIKEIIRGLVAHLKGKHGKLPSAMLLLMTELENEGKVFSRRPLVTLTGSDDRSLLYTGEASVPLLQAIREQFLGATSGSIVHRVAIFDDHGSIMHVISQLDIVRQLLANSPRFLGPLADLPISALGLPFTRSPLVAVDPDMPTMLAFDHMLGAGVSGAPVVNAKGDLIANLSISELRCIQPEHLGVLALPVAEFLALLHRTTYLGYSQGASKSKDHPFFAGTSPRAGSSGGGAAAAFQQGPPSPGGPGSEQLGRDEDIKLISVAPSSRLSEVLHLLGDNFIHRLYVVDPAAEPGKQLVGVLTPTDILCWAVGMAPPAHEATMAAPRPAAGPMAAHPHYVPPQPAQPPASPGDAMVA